MYRTAIKYAKNTALMLYPCKSRLIESSFKSNTTTFAFMYNRFPPVQRMYMTKSSTKNNLTVPEIREKVKQLKEKKKRNINSLFKSLPKLQSVF